MSIFLIEYINIYIKKIYRYISYISKTQFVLAFVPSCLLLVQVLSLSLLCLPVCIVCKANMFILHEKNTHIYISSDVKMLMKEKGNSTISQILNLRKVPVYNHLGRSLNCSQH